MDVIEQEARIERLEFATDQGAGERARIGLLVQETDQTMEWETRMLTDLPSVFISCPSVRTADIVEQVEAVLGKPVTASNHALAWHLLRLVGIPDKQNIMGNLFQI